MPDFRTTENNWGSADGLVLATDEKLAQRFKMLISGVTIDDLIRTSGRWLKHTLPDLLRANLGFAGRTVDFNGGLAILIGKCKVKPLSPQQELRFDKHFNLSD